MNYLLIFIILISSILLVLSDDKTTSKSVLERIIIAQHHPTTDPFSVTSVIRYKNGNFYLKGDILNLTDEDINDIKNNNFVYANYYTMTKTRLSRGTYQEIGAIIVGSSDESLKHSLHFAAMKKIKNKDL